MWWAGIKGEADIWWTETKRVVADIGGQEQRWGGRHTNDEDKTE